MSNFVQKAIESETVIETSVGITTHISNHQGFQGILKQRFNDFVVREIDLGGAVTGLKSTTITPDISALEDKYFKLASMGIEDFDSVITSVEALDKVSLRVSREEIRNFIQLCLSKSPECPTSLLLCSCEDKQQRSSVHQIMKKSYAVRFLIIVLLVVVSLHLMLGSL